MITRSSSNRSTFRLIYCLVMALGLAFVVTGCTTMSSYIPFMGKNKQKETFVKKLWSSGEQYVAIEKQDRQKGVAVRPNQHITEISVERVRAMLESMEIRSPNKDRNMTLFNEDEIKILSEYIPVGLALSGPDEDVTFAVIGLYVEALGVLKKREVTTGRVFYQDGRINIIFGDIHRELKETMGVKEDRRLNPFLPGSRAGSVGYQDGTILPKPGGEIFAKNRQDWVAFQMTSGGGEALAQAEQETEEDTPPARRENTGTLSPAPDNLASGTPKTTAPQAPPTEQKYTPPAATPRYTAAPVAPRYTGSAVRDYRSSAPVGQPAVKKSIEDRLVILNNLRSKRLITEDEYREKRMEILSEL